MDWKRSCRWRHQSAFVSFLCTLVRCLLWCAASSSEAHAPGYIEPQSSLLVRFLRQPAVVRPKRSHEPVPEHDVLRKVCVGHAVMRLMRARRVVDAQDGSPYIVTGVVEAREKRLEAKVRAHLSSKLCSFARNHWHRPARLVKHARIEAEKVQGTQKIRHQWETDINSGSARHVQTEELQALPQQRADPSYRPRYVPQASAARVPRFAPVDARWLHRRSRVTGMCCGDGVCAPSDRMAGGA